MTPFPKIRLEKMSLQNLKKKKNRQSTRFRQFQYARRRSYIFVLAPNGMDK